MQASKPEENPPKFWCATKATQPNNTHKFGILNSEENPSNIRHATKHSEVISSIQIQYTQNVN